MQEEQSSRTDFDTRKNYLWRRNIKMKNIKENVGITCIPQKCAISDFSTFIQAACRWQRTYTTKTLLVGGCCRDVKWVVAFENNRHDVNLQRFLYSTAKQFCAFLPSKLICIRIRTVLHTAQLQCHLFCDVVSHEANACQIMVTYELWHEVESMLIKVI